MGTNKYVYYVDGRCPSVGSFKQESQGKQTRDKAVTPANPPKHSHTHTHMQFPWDIVKQAWELGLLHVAIPTSCGGLGLGVLDEVIIDEELAYGCTGIMTIAAASILAVRVVLINY